MIGDQRPNREWPNAWLERDRPESQDMQGRGSGDESGGAVPVACHDPMLIPGSFVTLHRWWSIMPVLRRDQPCRANFSESDPP